MADPFDDLFGPPSADPFDALFGATPARKQGRDFMEGAERAVKAVTPTIDAAESLEGIAPGRYDYENQPLGKTQQRVDQGSSARSYLRDVNRTVARQPELEPFSERALDTGTKFIQNLDERAKRWVSGMAQANAQLPEDPITFALNKVLGRDDASQLFKDMSMEEGKRVFSEATAELQRNAPNLDQNDPLRYAYEIGNAFLDLGAAFTASVITRSPTVGSAMVGAQVFGDQYGDSIQRGRSAGQAFADASFMGAAEMIGEKIPLGILMQQGGKFAVRVAKGSAAEAVQEMVTQTLQTGYGMGILNDEMTWGEAVRSVIDAGIVGGGAGAGVGIVSAPFRRQVTAPGRIEAAEASVVVTPEDEASPLAAVAPIGEGKRLMEAARAKREGNAALKEAGAPAIGSKVSFQGQPVEIIDAITDEAGEHGVTVRHANGQTEKVYLNDLRDAGETLEPIIETKAGENPATEAQNPQISAITNPGEMSGRAQLKARIGQAESPNDTAKNPLSSAQGRYQFVDRTFLAYYHKVRPGNGETDDEILAKKTDGELQEEMMDRLLDDNERALSKAGFETDAGNLYLAHFAGSGGALRVLRNPQASAEALLGKKVIEANPQLKGMSGADVIAWARGKMGSGTAIPATEPSAESENVFLGKDDTSTAGTPILPAVAPRDDTTLAELAARGVGTRESPIDVQTPEDLDVAAVHVNEEPTEAQKESGTYKKGHIQLQGLDITIENPAGSTRRGTADDGTTWETTLPAAYGYVKRSTGNDGDQVDVYIGDNPASQRVFVVDQYDPKTGKFDEHKAVLGVNSAAEATAIYDAGFSDGSGPTRRRAVTEMGIDQFREFAASSDTSPAADNPIVADMKAELGAIEEMKRASKARAMRFQADDKDLVAAYLTATGKPTESAALDLPFKEWSAIRAANYDKAVEWKRAGGVSKAVTPKQGATKPKNFLSFMAEKLKAESYERGVPVRIDAESAIDAGVPWEYIYVRNKSRNARYDSIKVGLTKVFGTKKGRMSSRQMALRSFDRDDIDPETWGEEGRIEPFTPEEIGDLMRRAMEREPAEAAETAPDDGLDEARDRVEAFAAEGGYNLNADEVGEAIDHLDAGMTIEEAVQRVIADAAVNVLIDGAELTGNDPYAELAESIYVGDTAEERDRGAEEALVGPESDEGNSRGSGTSDAEPDGDTAEQQEGQLDGADPRLPDGFRVVEGRGLLGKGKWGVKRPSGGLVWNLHDSKEEAVLSAIATLNAEAESSARNTSDEARTAEIGKRLLAGGDPTDADLQFLDLKQSSLFEYISPVVQKLFGISNRRVREAMGNALYQTDKGGFSINLHWAAHTKKALKNAAEYARQQEGQNDAFGTRPDDQRTALERKGEGRKKASAAQKAPGSDGGLFDTAETTADLFATSDKQKATDAGSDNNRPDPIAQARDALQTAMAALDAVQAPPVERIEDAGEKIGGARKDRWAARGLALSDLEGMTQGEAFQFVTKEQVWPKPDYAKMVEDGITPEAAAGLKLLRDSLAAKPKTDSDEARRDYIETMGIVRELLADVTMISDLDGIQTKLFDAIGYSTDWKLSRTEEQKEPRRKLFSIAKGNRFGFSIGYAEKNKIRKMVAEGFPTSKAEPWTRRFRVVNYERKNAERPWFVAGNTQANRRIMIEEGFATQAEAEAAAKALYENKDDDGNKKAPERPHLDEVRRTGEDVRAGRDISSEDFIAAFGFRGVEYGNWAAGDERQKITNLAFEAMHDLASVLGIPPKALSLDGQLAMAFGARGASRFAAHYEPGKLVINMTKLNGAGSLAHEWGHALDHYFGTLDTDLGTRGAPKGASGWYERTQSRLVALGNLRPEMAAAFDQLMSTIFTKDMERADAVRAVEHRIEKLQAGIARQKAEVEKHLKNSEGGTPQKKFIKQSNDWIASQERALLAAGERLADLKDETKPLAAGKVETSFFRNAKALSGKSGEKGYWARPTEMLARSFESFVFDRIAERGNVSQYLVQGVEDSLYAEGYKGDPYPAKDERKAINDAYAALFETMAVREGPSGNPVLYSKVGGIEDDPNIFWHGSPSGEMRGSFNGLHLGTKEAARQALEARIGIPADGSDWDGTREYGKTLLAGAATQRKLREQGRNTETGFNSGAPEEDYYPTGKATYGDRSPIPMSAKPSLKAFRLIGPMSNSRYQPHEDFKANGYMQAQITKGRAKRGYFYENVGEDAGSISIVVPNGDHLEPIDDRIAFSKTGTGEDVFYSALERAIEQNPTKRAPAAQWAATLGKTPGVKKEELEWSGLFDWLDMQEGPVDREALLGVVRDGGIQVEEVVLGGDARSAGWNVVFEDEQWFPVSPEGDYLDPEVNERGAWHEAERQLRTTTGAQFKEWSSDPSNKTYRELLITLPTGIAGNPDRAPSTHWDTDAVVAHARFMEKADADGRRVLFVEEIQSDWLQKLRDQGSSSAKAIDNHFQLIVEGMKAAGIVKEVCD